MKIIRNVSAFGYLKKSKFVYYRIPAVTFNTASLVLVHDDDTVREVIEILKKKGSVDLHVACLEEVDTVNGGNVVVGSNVAGSSYDHEDHVVGQEHVEVEGGGRDAENGPQHVEVGPEGEDVRPKLAENEPQIGDNESIDGNGLEDVDVGPDAENGPKIVDNESSEDNGSEHVEVRPEITNIWTDHVDVDVGAGVADVNGNGANHIDVDDNGNGADHVDVDDNGNGADHVDVGPDSENGSQHAENGPDSDNGLDHVDIGPEVNEVEPELGDDRLELADDDTTDDNGAEDGLDGSEEDAFLFNIDIRSDVDEEVEDIREKGRGKRHKEKVADREHAANCEGKPVQPDNVDEGYRSSDKDGKLEGYETDYISSSDPGEYEDKEYANLWGYAAELLKSNPGSTISIQVHRNDVSQAVFFRIYVCLQGLKQGWKDGCRPFIGVNGCWLKTAQKGELLVAVGRDANNQMFPIAWAVVEVECASSWRWFLQKLFTDLEHPTGEGITLMSDQQKGLVKVLVEDYPDTEYRMCVRHLSTYIEEFDDNLQKLEKLGPTSTEDLLQNPVQHWAKAYFSATPTCDVVDNNMAEAFNAWILDARCKPIISLLEDIRVMVMSRLHVKRTWASKWRTSISPKALEKLERNMEQSTHCRLVWNGDGGFEVQHGEDQHIVDMKQLKCTCKAWELSGIPCCHAICATYEENKRPEDYVSNWYSKEKYLAAYNHVLQPVRGKIFWPKTSDPIQPPLVRTLPGRPKKKRKKDKDEPTKGKTNPVKQRRCTNCRQPGHNKLSCPTKMSQGTTQNVASSTTGPPGMVHGTPQNVASPTTQNVGSATTGSLGMVHGTTHNVASATTNPTGMVHSTTQNVASTISQPGTSTERVVTRASKRKSGEADPSQFQYHSKGKGLRWKGNTAVTIRQLQENVETVRKKRGRPPKSQTLGTQSS
ncbi:hypothetical protein V6N13_051136 [Hibiscus sabdariffa]